MVSTPIWNEPIDWAHPFEEEISFSTEIITSRDGSEQRIAQRVNPRVTWRWRSMVTGSTFGKIDGLMAARQAQEIALTDPFAEPVGIGLNGVGNIGDTSLTLPASGKPSWFAQGKHMVLVGANGVAEIVQTTGNALATFYDLAQPLENYFPGGTSYLRDAVFGRIAGKSDLRAITDRTGTFEMEVELSPGRNVARNYGAAATTYDGRELFDLSPNWAAGVPMGFEQMHEAHDFGRGVVDRTIRQDHTTRTFTLRHMIRDEATRDLILGNFHRNKGRQKAFHVPLWPTTLFPALPISAGVNVAFTGPSMVRNFGDQTMYRHVRIKTRSNGVLTREVTGLTLDGGDNSVMVLTSALPAISADDLISMHWLVRARHESDRLSVDWITGDIAEVTMTLRTLKESDA